MEVWRESALASKFRGKFVAFRKAGVVGENSQFGAFPCVASSEACEVAASRIGTKAWEKPASKVKWEVMKCSV